MATVAQYSVNDFVGWGNKKTYLTMFQLNYYLSLYAFNFLLLLLIVPVYYP